MALDWNGGDAVAAILRGATRGLNKAAEALLSESQSRVPVDENDLRNSGSVHQASPADLTAAVTYDTPYAVIQHERLDFHHPLDHNPGAQAKYLERPARELEQQLQGVVAREIRRETRS